MVSRQAEENQELEYLHNWCKEVRKEIFSEKRHLAQRVEAEGGKSSVPEFPCLPNLQWSGGDKNARTGFGSSRVSRLGDCPCDDDND